MWLSDTPSIVKERVVDYDERPVFPDYTPYAYEVGLDSRCGSLLLHAHRTNTLMTWLYI